MPLLLPGIGDGARLPAAGGNGWVLSPARIENPDPAVLSGDSRLAIAPAERIAISIRSRPPGIRCLL